MRLKSGTIREDGMIFRAYRRGQEYWVLPEVYAVGVEKHRATCAAWHQANIEKARAKSAAWRKANPEKAQATAATWRKAHPEKKRAICAAWYKANLEKAKATAAAWYKANPEKKRAKCAAWRRANPEKAQAACAAWRKANPEKMTLKTARRRALKLAAVPDDANKAFVTGLYAIANRVSKCLGISHDVDHIVPLALGGSHCHRNLQVIPSTWNYRKHDRYDYPLPDCYRTDGWLIL
jgi:hypothetical protein